jgi:hypothetical protein
VNPGILDLEQFKFNVPNLPLFAQGTVPFLGDYIEVVPSPMFVPAGNGWTYNFMPSVNPLFHATWTDNRDVVAPRDGNWSNYTPPVPYGTTSIFQPGKTVPTCTVGNEGMRNQNIYTAQITGGLVVGAPGNAKPLGTTTFNNQQVPFQRAFAVVAQNVTNHPLTVRFTIVNQPPGGSASFLQFSQLTNLDFIIPAFSSVSRSVFVTSSNPLASVTVNVAEITGVGGSLVTNGLSFSTVINPDVTNPTVTNPTVTNPTVTNPTVTNFEITNPTVTNPTVTNPTVTNPTVTNPTVTNPTVTNPAVTNVSATNPTVTNPTVTNPDVPNPTVTNPTVTNPTVTNGAIQDLTSPITNIGNTFGTYTVKVGTTVLPPGGILLQLILNKLYQTPGAANCQLSVETHWVPVANITTPKLFSLNDPQLGNPDIANPTPNEASIALGPGETGYITIRVFNPSHIPFDPQTTIFPVTVPQAVDTLRVLSNPNPNVLPTPLVVIPLTITTTALPVGIAGQAYNAPVQAVGGTMPYVWSISSGILPAGLTINPSSGVISGTPTSAGSFSVTVRVRDAGLPSNTFERPLFIAVVDPIKPAFTGTQTGPNQWTYTLTFAPLVNYSVFQNTTNITLTGLSGVTSAAGPTSTDFPSGGSPVDLNAVNLNWSAAVLNGGTKVVFTHAGPGTGNFGDFRHAFGFTINASGAVNGAAPLATSGFSRDTTNALPNETFNLDITGTTDGPVRVASSQLQPRLWLGNDQRGDVFQTTTTGTVTTDLPSLSTTGIAWDGSNLFFADPSGNFTKRTSDGKTVLDNFVIGPFGGEDLAWDGKRKVLWRILHTNALQKIDPVAHTVLATYAIPQSDPGFLTTLGGLGIAYDSMRDKLYVSFCKAGCDTSVVAGLVDIVDPNTGSISGTLFRTNGFFTGGLAYDPATDTVWVGDTSTVRNMDRSGNVLASFTRPLPGAFVDGLEFVSGVSVHGTGVSTLSGGEALAANLSTGDLYVKSLQDPAGSNVQLVRVQPNGAVSIVGSFASLSNSDGSGIALDPQTGGIIVADEASQRIALVSISSEPLANTLFLVPWKMNPQGNGTGQQRYGTDPQNPLLLYFWDSTTAKLYRLDRSTGSLTTLLALDKNTADGLHVTTASNHVVFDPAAGTVLVTDAASNSILELNPTTATSTTLAANLPITPLGIALSPASNQIFVETSTAIYALPRAGGTSLSTLAAGFTSLTDMVVGKASSGNGFSLFAVDRRRNTVYEILMP